MSEHPPQFAILLDGNFVVRKLKPRLHRFPVAEDVEDACSRIRNHSLLRGLALLRIYFYDAPPASGSIRNPLSGAQLNLSCAPVVAKFKSLHDALELKPDFALRLGECITHGWQIKPTIQTELFRHPRPLIASDLSPQFEQKGVDLRIGLDIARLALCHHVRTVVVVTGDSDFVPALKFARREGIRVYLDTMGHGVRRDLKAHADQVIDAALPPACRPFSSAIAAQPTA